MQLYKVSRIWSDPLSRNLCSGSLFTISFIWAAIHFFGVESEIIKTFLVLTFLFVAVMMLVGLILFPLILLFRKKKPIFLKRVSKRVGTGEGDSSK